MRLQIHTAIDPTKVTKQSNRKVTTKHKSCEKVLRKENTEELTDLHRDPFQMLVTSSLTSFNKDVRRFPLF